MTSDRAAPSIALQWEAVALMARPLAIEAMDELELLITNAGEPGEIEVVRGFHAVLRRAAVLPRSLSSEGSTDKVDEGFGGHS